MAKIEQVQRLLNRRQEFTQKIRSDPSLAGLIAWGRFDAEQRDSSISIHSIWSAFPETWKKAFISLRSTDIAELATKQEISVDLPGDLADFIRICRSFDIARPEDPILSEKARISTHPSLMNLTPKKKYEVLVLSQLIDMIYGNSKTDALLDIGCGKGHLCRVLTYHYGISTIGVDVDARNIESANKLSSKAESIRINSQAQSKRGKKAGHVFYQTSPLCSSMTRDEVFSSCHVPEGTNACLLGLHACGDLSTMMLRMYASTNSAPNSNSANLSAIVSVGCCYNLLSTPDTQVEGQHGFPMSDFVQSGGFRLAYQELMLACRSLHRWSSFDDVEERFIRDGLHLMEVGRKDETHSSVNYDKAVAAIKTSDDPSTVDAETARLIKGFQTHYPDGVKQMIAVDTLRSIIAPLFESMVHLDRLLFLLERGFAQSWLVQVFEPEVSPRCLAIVSVKEGREELEQLMETSWRPVR